MIGYCGPGPVRRLTNGLETRTRGSAAGVPAGAGVAVARDVALGGGVMLGESASSDDTIVAAGGAVAEGMGVRVPTGVGGQVTVVVGWS
jgi:hypothetical protein